MLAIYSGLLARVAPVFPLFVIELPFPLWLAVDPVVEVAVTDAAPPEHFPLKLLDFFNFFVLCEVLAVVDEEEEQEELLPLASSSSSSLKQEMVVTLVDGGVALCTIMVAVAAVGIGVVATTGTLLCNDEFGNVGTDMVYGDVDE